MQIIEKDIEELRPYENNPRKNENTVEYVKNSIQEFGFKVPLVVDKEGVIVCGHTRYQASIELGLKKIPCIIADDLTEEQIRLFRIADNKISEYSTWDLDKLEEELETISLDIEKFGIEELEHINIESFFQDKEDNKQENKEDKKPETITVVCPQCGHIHEVEI